MDSTICNRQPTTLNYKNLTTTTPTLKKDLNSFSNVQYIQPLTSYISQTLTWTLESLQVHHHLLFQPSTTNPFEIVFKW
jgi:hypothetical protein